MSNMDIDIQDSYEVDNISIDEVVQNYDDVMMFYCIAFRTDNGNINYINKHKIIILYN